jgi:putative phosphonate metabolism protein
MMLNFERYAVFYAPKQDSALADFGCSWLGWHAENKCAMDRPNIEGLSKNEIENITKTATRYGFHATLKPPFHLAEGKTVEQLDLAIQSMAASLSPLKAGPLKLAKIGSFIALVPSDGALEISTIADTCVSLLDGFRRPLSHVEVMKRRANRLSESQDALLLKWGYPYVMDEFRFHLTLSDRLEGEQMNRIYKSLETECAEILSHPFMIEDICLFGDPGNGQHFHLIKRYAL